MCSAPIAETSAFAELSSVAAAAPKSGCADGMVEVVGDYCAVLEQTCTRWLDPEGRFPRRCAEFAPSGACQTPTVRKHFCVDRFEYPNRQGVMPVVMKRPAARVLRARARTARST